MCTGVGEVFAKEGEAMLNLKQIAKVTVAPVSHPHASRIPATFAAMVCSSSRA